MLARVTLINRLKSDENGALTGHTVLLAIVIVFVIAIIAGVSEWYHH